jgi:glycosyltransferase involved in cell wall biosynthesis
MTAVSVIVPNYNHARYLRDRVESILAQTYRDYELILLDDYSTDGSREVLSSYAGIKGVQIEFNESNSGTPFKQWNKGVRRAKGKYIWIAESDDYADPRLLERLVAALEQQDEVTLAYCRSQRIDQDGKPCGFADSFLDRWDAKRWKANYTADGLEECRRYYVLAAPIPNTSSVVFRRKTYEEVGGADEALHLCGDYKVFASMAMNGRIAYCSEALNFYRTHQVNARTLTEAGGLGVAEYFYVMCWVIDHVGPPETLAGRPKLLDVYSRLPAEMSSTERMQVARRAVANIAAWNLMYNPYFEKRKIREYFRDWELAVVGKEFALSPPSRWRFFLHRANFYRQYSASMDWRQKAVNFLRVIGAPVVGYRRRHWPQRVYEWMAETLHKSTPD